MSVQLLIFALIGIVLTASRGHYYVPGIVAFSGIALMFPLAFRTTAPRIFTSLAGPLVAGSTLWLAGHPGLVNASANLPSRILQLSLFIAAAASWLWAASYRLRKPAFWVATATLTLAALLVPLASPAPFIDVWVHLTQAVDEILNFRNPYLYDFKDIYDGAFLKYQNHRIGPPYPPGEYFWLPLFRAATGDIRYGFIACHLFLAFLARKKSPQNQALVLLWLSFPASLFVLEQSWNDPLALAAAGLAASLLATGAIFAAGAACGFMLITKQYTIFLALLLMIFTYRKRSYPEFLEFSFAAFGTALFFCLPFMVHNAASFFDMTVMAFLNYGVRPDSLSAVAWFHNAYQWKFPGVLSLLIYGAAFSMVGARLWRRHQSSLSSLFTESAFVYFVVFFFGKAAFCNYYYFVAGLLFLGFVFREKRPVKESNLG